MTSFTQGRSLTDRRSSDSWGSGNPRYRAGHVATHRNRATGVSAYTNLDEGIVDVDVVMMLRLQLERMEGQLIPSSQEYFRCYGLTQERLNRAAPDAVVMHPGPMNRGLEIASEVADSERSLILSQVKNGIAVRMAIMAELVGLRLELRHETEDPRRPRHRPERRQRRGSRHFCG